MSDAPRYWTGETRPAEPGWRAARLELLPDAELRRIVTVASWGVPAAGDLVPLDEAGVRLDGPELVCVAPAGTTDAELWTALARRSAEVQEVAERGAREEAA